MPLRRQAEAAPWRRACFAGAIREAETLVVFDTVITRRANGTLSVWKNVPGECAEYMRGSTYGLGLSEALRLAHIPGRLPKRLYVYGVDAQSFERWGEDAGSGTESH